MFHRPRLVRFGVFEADFRTGELRKRGRRVALQKQPLLVLETLLEQPGQVVNRDELGRRLWPEGTFVDLDAGLNTAIRKLRRALGDPAESPRFVETLPRLGYRFIATVETVPEAAAPEAGPATLPVDGAVEGVPARLRRPASRHRRVAAATALAAAGISLAIFVWRGPLVSRHEPSHAAGGGHEGIRSIAVMPLVNIGPPEEEYFADGLTEALITDLAKIEALKVISRWSVMQYKGSAKPLPEIARELGVEAMVEGSVLRSNDRVRISMQLIEAATDHHLWAESYERELRDVLALQGEVTHAIAREIRARVTPDEEKRIASSRPIDPAAHDAYLKGLDYYDRAIRRGGQIAGQTTTLETAVEHFQRAVELEPDWAEAHAKLAEALHFLASDSDAHSERVAERYAQSKAEAHRALELNDTLADAHASLAFVLYRYDWDWHEAEREFRRAVALNPNAGHWGYALFLRSAGRFDESIREYQKARERDPQMPMLHGQLIRTFACAGRIDDAVRESESFDEFYPGDLLVRYSLGITYLLAGRFEEAIPPLEKAAARVDDVRPNLGYAYARAGRTAEAEAVLRQLERDGVGWFPELYLALGSEEEALGQLEAAFERHDDYLLGIRCSPEFESLMNLPRFQRIYEAIGFPDLA